ncbi:MAG: Gfo/Idh/MocA family oxidoreductase, partial [bacterium]|nr:Gfo/Idh/MocA family oxidoreductase [bacterium]
GDIEEVFGIASSNIWDLDGSEDNGYALMRSPRGEIATLHATWSEWKGYRFHIEAYGDRGMARAYYAPMMSMLVSMDRPGGRRRRKYHFYPSNIIREKLRGWQSTTERTFHSEFADFLKLCKGEKGDIADGFDGFRAVEIANAVYRCTEEKKSIRLENPF